MAQRNNEKNKNIKSKKKVDFTIYKILFFIMSVAVLGILLGCYIVRRPKADDSAEVSVRPMTLLQNNLIYSRREENIEDIMITGKSAYIEGIDGICQHPDYPAGCEVVSLAVVLDFYGLEVDLEDLVENHLEKGEIGSSNPYVEFVGDPRLHNAYGCFAPVLVKCAQSYGVEAMDISSYTFDKLLEFVDGGLPVIVWGTIGMRKSNLGSSVWKDRYGNMVTWPGGEHCLVMVGYDTNKDEVYLSDPSVGHVVTYNMREFYERWIEMDRQAVVVY